MSEKPRGHRKTRLPGVLSYFSQNGLLRIAVPNVLCRFSKRLSLGFVHALLCDEENACKNNEKCARDIEYRSTDAAG